MDSSVSDRPEAAVGDRQLSSTLLVFDRSLMTHHPLYRLLTELEAAGVFFVLSRHRPDSVLVSITFVGERVEVDVFDDGHMEVSRFRGNEDVVGGEDLVKSLIAELT